MVEQLRDAGISPICGRGRSAGTGDGDHLREALGQAERRAQWREVAEQPPVQNAVGQLAHEAGSPARGAERGGAARQGPGELLTGAAKIWYNAGWR
jgi:hypothetical protein